jgi:serine/threonine-protein kinase HipA
MKLHVFVREKPVATLDSPDGFRHVLTYHPDIDAESFASLLMPVRTESYAYPELHPLFRMNLPEGFLLSILQEQLGPEIGASPLNLLSVVGRHSIGRVKLAVPGADPAQPPVAFELASLLKGDNSEEVFVELVRRYARSGVSGVVPKFLSPAAFDEFGKGTVATDRYIVKGTTSRLPGVALNEHLCMEVARKAGISCGDTQVSEDGQALVVVRFDYERDGVTRKGMEDLCSLLALRPEQKYDATWEEVATRIKQIVTIPAQQNAALSQLTDLILLSYALRNSDCHTKNIALLYSSRNDVTLSPVYDMLTITAYADYSQNSPGLLLGGRKTWRPGKSLEIYFQTFCNLRPTEVKSRVERICESIIEVAPRVIEAAESYPQFREIAKRMLLLWNEGMNSLRLQKTWILPTLHGLIENSKLSAPKKKAKREKIGRSPLLGGR